MKIQPYIEKLNSSKEYKSFAQKHKDAFLIAGFFIVDYESKTNLNQMDYFIPSEKKVAAFTLSEPVSMQTMELLDAKAPEKLVPNAKIDIDEIPGILEDEMKNRSITEEIKKMIAVLQNVEGKKIWNINCILSGMGILKVHIDDDSKTILRMDKISMVDLMKKMPGGAGGMAMPQQTGAPQVQVLQKGKGKSELKEQIKKLDMIEKEIEREKKALKKESKSSKGKKAKKGTVDSEQAEESEEIPFEAPEE